MPGVVVVHADGGQLWPGRRVVRVERSGLVDHGAFDLPLGTVCEGMPRVGQGHGVGEPGRELVGRDAQHGEGRDRVAASAEGGDESA